MIRKVSERRHFEHVNLKTPLMVSEKRIMGFFDALRERKWFFDYPKALTLCIGSLSAESCPVDSGMARRISAEGFLKNKHPWGKPGRRCNPWYFFDHIRIFNKRDHPYFFPAFWAGQGINFIQFLDQSRPVFPELSVGQLRLEQAGDDFRHPWFFAPTAGCVAVVFIVTHHLFAFTGDMAGHSGKCLHPAALQRGHSRASNTRVACPSLDR